jgi:hypothetical protein
MVSDAGSTAATANRISSDPLDEAIRSVEKTAESVVALCQNDVMLRALGNMNDRTRFVRMIDLEAGERMNEVRLMSDESCSALQRNDVAGAVAIQRKYRDGLTERMPVLVKEGISRVYTTPSWILLPSQFDAGLSTLRERPMANRNVFPRR